MNYTISDTMLRNIANSCASLMTKEILQVAYPDVFRPALKAGDFVELKGTLGLIQGIVADKTVSRLVNKHFGYGEFVIITRTPDGKSGGSHSHGSAQAAAEAGWRKVETL